MIGYRSAEIQNETFSYLVEWTPEADCVFVDNTPNNVPLTELWNDIVCQNPTYKYIVLINADVWVTPSWIRPLLRVFRDPDVAVVGPGSNAGTQTADLGRPLNSFPPRRSWLEDCSAAAIARYKGQYWDQEIHGFCYALRRSSWELAGGFNEEIPFYGNETEFNRRLRQKGQRLVKCPEGWVYHYGGHSVKASRKKNRSGGLPDESVSS